MGPAWTLPLTGSPKFKKAALATGEQHLNGVEHLITHHTVAACQGAQAVKHHIWVALVTQLNVSTLTATAEYEKSQV